MKKYMLILLCMILAVISVFLVLGRKDNAPITSFVRTDLGAAELRAVSVCIDKGELTVSVGGTASVVIETGGTEVTADCTEGMLTVNTAGGSSPVNSFVRVLLPEGTCPDTCGIELGVGKLTVDGIAFREGSVACGVGDSLIRFANIPEKLEIRSGSGDVNASFPGTEEIRIRAPFGLGARNYAGRFVSDESSGILIDVSLGNTTLN